MTATVSSCQHCTQHIEHPSALAGAQAECPHCGASTLLGIVASPPARPMPAAVGGPEKVAVNVASFWGTVCLAGGSILVVPVACVMVVAVFGVIFSDQEGRAASAVLLGMMVLPMVGGVFLFRTGQRLSSKLVCSDCGTDTTREQQVCAVCRARFESA